jgi:hypothetical protein
MSVPRRMGKGTRDSQEVGPRTSKRLSARMHQGEGYATNIPERSVGIEVRMHQRSAGHPNTGPKDLAQRQRQGSIKE